MNCYPSLKRCFYNVVILLIRFIPSINLIFNAPKAKDTYYQRRKKHRLFCKRAGIEPTIGHLKTDYRLGRNFYKGVVGDAINLMLAAAAYNFKRAMRSLPLLLKRISETLTIREVSLKYTF